MGAQLSEILTQTGCETDRVQLRQWMEQCRQVTLSLFTDIDHETFCRQAHPDFSPIGWHLGHIAYTEGLWILEHLAGMPRQFPEYRRLFAADTLPKCDRVHLPSLADVCAYLQTIREQVFTYLGTAAIAEQERHWLWLLQHESQHCETIAIVSQLQQKPKFSPLLPCSPAPSLPLLPSPVPSNMVYIPAGEFIMGSDSVFALDNERPIQRVFLEGYWLDPTPVTCGQYRQFMQAGGYSTAEWWSEAGWAWVQAHVIDRPLYWHEEPSWENYPVWGVSWYEADAYARFVGKRLPTEAEWEKAACWHPELRCCQPFPWGEAVPTADRCNHSLHVGHPTPVTAYEHGKSAIGCYDLLGNVWEWTDTWFNGYPEFAAYPYRGYSQAYFDGQHRVLRGGSWATQPWVLRSSLRNWYHPHVQEIFAGFRCAQ